jgi:hypothetical protein
MSAYQDQRIANDDVDEDASDPIDGLRIAGTVCLWLWMIILSGIWLLFA